MDFSGFPTLDQPRGKLWRFKARCQRSVDFSHASAQFVDLLVVEQPAEPPDRCYFGNMIVGCAFEKNFAGL